jgi:photosystem II stability/assembly factor-like uncharacterized protein
MKKMSILVLVLGAFALSAQKAPQDNLRQMEIQDRHRFDLLGRQYNKYDIKRFLFSATPEEISRQNVPFDASRIAGGQGYSSAWQSIGPEGGNVADMVFNPLNKNEIFAVTYGYPGPIFKTVNSGLTWTKISSIDNFSLGIAIDPINSNTIYVPAYPEIYKSLDGGKSWHSNAFCSGFYYSGEIAINPINHDIIYLAAEYDESGFRAMAVLKSVNSGEKWTGMKLAPSSQNVYASTYSVAIDPSNPDILYAGGYYNDGSNYMGKVYKTTDAGQNWTDITGSILGCAESIVIDPSNPSKVYVGTSSGIYRSSDGGQTWQKDSGYASAYALAIDPSDHNILYAGCLSCCYKSIDGGASWTQYSGGLYGTCNKLLASSASPTRVYCASSFGIYISDDSGITWKASHSGIRACLIPTLAIAPSSPNIIYAEVTSGGLFKSENFGSSWQRLLDFTWNITKIAVNPNDAKNLFIIIGAGGSSGIYKSVDGGLTWTKKFGGYYDDLIINKNNINHVFIAGQERVDSTYVMTLHKSTDGGENWNTYKITTTNGYGHSVAIDPNNDDVIYVGGDYNDGQTTRGVLFKTIDGGSSWTQIWTQTSKDITYWVYAMAVDPDFPNKVFIGTCYGIYKSEDSGSSWRQTSSFDVSCIKISPNLTNEIFAAGREGVYFSNDGGNSWNAFNEGLTCIDVVSLDMDVPGSILYAGTEGGSVFKNSLLGLYSMVINAGLGGITDPSPGIYRYDPGKEITIRATPNTDYRFNQWSGDVPQGHEKDNPITITIDSDKSITANFIRQYTLTTASGTGGTIDPAPGSYKYDTGTQVSLKATPDNDYRFSLWSGDVFQGHEKDNPLTITMDSNKSITANFIRQYTLTLASGSGGTTDPTPGSYKYDTGTQVTLIAKANSGYKFSGWSGDVSGSTNPIIITMDSNKSITANFTAEEKKEEKKGCFIATAAYGSPLHPSVTILREFRDEYLMPSKIGRAFVRLYYKYSPAAADFIAKHKALRISVQVMLLPLIALSYSMLHLGPVITGIILGLIFVFPFFILKRLYSTKVKSLDEIKTKYLKIKFSNRLHYMTEP